MIGSRVKHAKGIGTVTGVGAKGVTVDGEHKIPHGEYQQHEEEHDLPVLAEAYAKWRRRLPEHLAQGPRSKMGVTAALAATLDQHLAGQMDFDELTLHRLQAVIKALKANKGPHLFSVPGSDGTPVEVGDADVETYLQGFGLSRRGLEAYHANRSVHDEHAKTGDVAKAQKAAAARVNVRNPETLVDPRLGPALEARQKRPQAMDAHADGHRRFAAFTKQMAGGAGEAVHPDEDGSDD